MGEVGCTGRSEAMKERHTCPQPRQILTTSTRSRSWRSNKQQTRSETTYLEPSPTWSFSQMLSLSSVSSKIPTRRISVRWILPRSAVQPRQTYLAVNSSTMRSKEMNKLTGLHKKVRWTKRTGTPHTPMKTCVQIISKHSHLIWMKFSMLLRPTSLILIMS